MHSLEVERSLLFMKIQGDDKSVDVAVKVWNDELEVTVSNFLSEAEILRLVLSFYGS